MRTAHTRGLGRTAILAVVGACVLALTGVASAQTAPDDPLIDQYSEQVPTGSGSTPSNSGGDGGGGSAGGSGGGGGGGSSAGAGLDSQVESALYNQVSQETARDLETVATHPGYGAPTKVEAVRKTRPTATGAKAAEPPTLAPPSEPSGPSFVGAAARAVAGDDAGAKLLGLLAVLAALTVGLIAAARIAQRGSASRA